MDDDTQHGPGGRWLFIVAVVLAGLGVLLVVVGRLLDTASFDGWQDPFYTVLLAFTLDGTFLGPQNPVTVVGAFAAAVAVYLAVTGGALVLLGSEIIAWRARSARGHFVLLGEADEVVALAGELAGNALVVIATPRKLAGPLPRRVLSIERPATTAGLIAAVNLHRARAVVTMRRDENLNAAMATSLASARPASSRTAIWCRVSDRVIADRVCSPTFGTPRIEVFDEAPIMARDAIGRHPTHAAAERLGAVRVHVVIAGFGRLGQAMAEAAVFSGIAAGLERPLVTVLDSAAAALGARYRATRPALALAADFAFIDIDLVAAATAPALAAEAFAALAARDELAPVSGLALCLPSDVDNVRLALALPELRRREGRYFAPTFMRVRDRETCRVVLDPEAPNVVDANDRVIPLGQPLRLLASDIIDGARRDRAAQALHEAGYRRRGQASSAAGGAWSALPETYRRANRRAADHLPVKLAALGLATLRDPQQKLTVSADAFDTVVAPLLAAPSGDARLALLAALEHRRWLAERAFDGWSPGTPRDDDLKRHPLMLAEDYGALAESDRQKDRDQVQTALGTVAAGADGAMPELRVALAGHRDLDAAELRRAVEEAVARLAAAINDRPGRLVLLTPLAPGADMALAEALVVAFAGRPGGVRLELVETVPHRVVLEVAAAESAAVDVAGLLAQRAALLARFRRVDVVRLGFAGVTDDAYRRDAALFERGLARANAYMARRAQLALVLWDGAPARGRGGTGEFVALCRDPASAADDVKPLPSLPASTPELLAVNAAR